MMAMRFKKKISIILLLAVFALSPKTAYAVTPEDLAGQFICQCGCTLVLNNCTHVECHSRTTMMDLINQKLDQGQSAEQITQFFVAQYGEQVLASPPKKGFNLVAWTLPFAALLFGGGVVYFVLRKWARLGKQPERASTVEIDEMSEQYEQQLEQELADFTERSFR